MKRQRSKVYIYHRLEAIFIIGQRKAMPNQLLYNTKNCRKNGRTVLQIGDFPPVNQNE